VAADHAEAQPHQRAEQRGNDRVQPHRPTETQEEKAELDRLSVLDDEDFSTSSPDSEAIAPPLSRRASRCMSARSVMSPQGPAGDVCSRTGPVTEILWPPDRVPHGSHRVRTGLLIIDPQRAVATESKKDARDVSGQVLHAPVVCRD
jgi:hypothetical protein